MFPETMCLRSCSVVVLSATQRETQKRSIKCTASQTWPTIVSAVAPSAFSYLASLIHAFAVPAHRVLLVSLHYPPGCWQKATPQYTAVVAGADPDVLFLGSPGELKEWSCC